MQGSLRRTPPSNYEWDDAPKEDNASGANPGLLHLSEGVQAASAEASAQAISKSPDRNTSSARWLSESVSPYGFSDDDGTLKQIDRHAWQRAFGGGQRKRFVAQQNGRWQSGSGGSSSGTSSVGGGTWLLQAVAAAVLVAAGVYANRVPDTPLSQTLQSAYRFAFATDYSGRALPLLESVLARVHVSVPILSRAGAIQLHVPLVGQIATDYSASHPEMIITGTANEPVLAAGAGTVTSVSGGKGNYTVVIDHGGIGITTYGGLGTVSVSSGQAVSVGEAIGRLSNTAHPQLRFALQRDGHYENPHDVIVFSGENA